MAEFADPQETFCNRSPSSVLLYDVQNIDIPIQIPHQNLVMNAANNPSLIVVGAGSPCFPEIDVPEFGDSDDNSQYEDFLSIQISPLSPYQHSLEVAENNGDNDMNLGFQHQGLEENQQTSMTNTTDETVKANPQASFSTANFENIHANDRFEDVQKNISENVSTNQDRSTFSNISNSHESSNPGSFNGNSNHGNYNGNYVSKIILGDAGPWPPKIIIERKILRRLEHESWTLTATKLRLEQSYNCFDEDYKKQKKVLNKLESRFKFATKDDILPRNNLQFLICFAKVDSLRKGRAELDKRLRIFRAECKDIIQRRDEQRAKVHRMQNHERLKATMQSGRERSDSNASDKENRSQKP